MWPVSARFLETLAKDHVVRQRVEILVDGDVAHTIDGITTFDPVTGARVASVGGSVSVQRALVRRSCSIDFLDLDASLTPTDAKDLLAPFRNEIRVYRGVQYWDATPAEIFLGQDVEYCPIGTFIIARIGGQYPVKQVTGYDRLWDLRGRFPSPYSIAAGSNTMSALRQLLQNILPDSRTDLNLPDLTFTTPLIVKNEQDDQGQLAQDLATSCGYILYADPMGQITVQLESEVDPDNVVWTFKPGPGNISARPERDIDATDAYNAVVTHGLANDGSTTGIRGYAKDDNPASLTYVGTGPLITFFHSSPLYTGPGQANLGAATILARELGVADTVIYSGSCIPCLESGDLVFGEDTDQDISGIMIADEFDVPMRGIDRQQISTRTQVLT